MTIKALENSARLKEAEGDTLVARALWGSAKDLRNPTLRLAAGHDDIHASNVARDTRFSYRIRFYPRHPWELRARLKKRLAEVSLADFLYHAKEREIILQVREFYCDAQFAHKEYLQEGGMVDLMEMELERLRALGKSRQITLDKVLSFGSKVVEEKPKRIKASQKYEKARTKLAAYAGVNPSEVSLSDRMYLANLKMTPATTDMLVETAFLMRPELGEVTHKEAIARGALRELDAKKIPWFSFVEVGDSSTLRNSKHVEDSYTIRVGIELPIFNYFNRDSKVHKERIRSFREQAFLVRRQIETEVRSAVRQVLAIQSDTAGFEREVFDHMAELRETLPKTARGTPYRLSKVAKELDISRLGVYSAYHDAVLELERSLGVDIQTAFKTAP